MGSSALNKSIQITLLALVLFLIFSAAFLLPQIVQRSAQEVSHVQRQTKVCKNGVCEELAAAPYNVGSPFTFVLFEPNIGITKIAFVGLGLDVVIWVVIAIPLVYVYVYWRNRKRGLRPAGY